MEPTTDILQQYRHISTKLKKRFLKKPNVSEGSEQFGHLAKQLHSRNCPHYAGFCHLAQARCEHTLSNSVSEAAVLTAAARSFCSAEDQLLQLHLPSFAENITAAVNCFSHAIRVHLENRQGDQAAALSTELGHALGSSGRTAETIQHYQRAAELQIHNPLDCLMSLSFIGSAKISIGDYEGALSVLTEMTYLVQEHASVLSSSSVQPVGTFIDILATCELSRVLLLLLLQPTLQRIRPEHAQTLEKYSWETTGLSTASSNYLNDDLYLLMQSLVMACQTHDVHAVKRLEVDILPHLSAEQSHLLHQIVVELESPHTPDLLLSD